MVAMKAYSDDLRLKVVSFVKKGNAKAEATRRFDISWRTVHRYCVAELDEGRLAPKPRPGRRKTFDDDAIRREVRARPSATLEDYAKVFGVSHVAIWKRLRQLAITLKKNS